MQDLTQPELQYEAEMLLQLPKFEYGQVMIRVCDRKLQETRKNMEDHPITDCEDIRRDVKYILGFMAALNWMISRPQEAQRQLELMSSRRETA